MYTKVFTAISCGAARMIDRNRAIDNKDTASLFPALQHSTTLDIGVCFNHRFQPDKGRTPSDLQYYTGGLSAILRPASHNCDVSGSGN